MTYMTLQDGWQNHFIREHHTEDKSSFMTIMKPAAAHISQPVRVLVTCHLLEAVMRNNMPPVWMKIAKKHKITQKSMRKIQVILAIKHNSNPAKSSLQDVS